MKKYVLVKGYGTDISIVGRKLFATLDEADKALYSSFKRDFEFHFKGELTESILDIMRDGEEYEKDDLYAVLDMESRYGYIKSCEWANASAWRILEVEV